MIKSEPTWTPERVEALKRLWAEGHSASVVARMLEIKSRNSVISKVHRLKLPARMQAQGTAMKRHGGRKRYAPQSDRPKLKPIMNPDPRPVFIERTPEQTVSFADLEPHHCRYPYGESDYRFCGCDKVPGQSYCAHHMRIAYSVPSPKRIPLQEIAEKVEKVEA